MLAARPTEDEAGFFINIFFFIVIYGEAAPRRLALQQRGKKWNEHLALSRTIRNLDGRQRTRPGRRLALLWSLRAWRLGSLRKRWRGTTI